MDELLSLSYSFQPAGKSDISFKKQALWLYYGCIFPSSTIINWGLVPDSTVSSVSKREAVGDNALDVCVAVGLKLPLYTCQCATASVKQSTDLTTKATMQKRFPIYTGMLN